MSALQGAQTSSEQGSASSKSQQFIYRFGGSDTDGRADMRLLLGGKGANLAEMTNVGVPVPPGLTITTEVSRLYSELGNKWPDGLEAELKEKMQWLESVTGKGFGDPKNPLLVSVRSGAPVSMPGMMDTVLNLGLNDDTVEGMAKKSNNARFAYDSYRRFIQMFGDVVLEVPHKEFEKAIIAMRAKQGVETDAELSEASLRALVDEYKAIIKKATGKSFPSDPFEQLAKSINAVFASWNNERAVVYRRLNEIPDSYGTAVNVQSMVYGNMGDTSATGVCFTRDPSTGEHVFYGEYLVNAQGEDVVAGIRTPKPVAEMAAEFPEIHKQLVQLGRDLEKYFKDIQDLEFTMEEGKLYLLQTRTGKRTARAAVKIACDMVREGLLDSTGALLRIDPAQIDKLLHPTVDPDAKKEVIAKGLPASPGAAVGKIVFDSKEAVELKAKGEGPLILVREETSPEDIGGMDAAQGILTARGGMTSHAAVVARGMGKPCVAGCSEIHIDEDAGTLKAGGKTLKAGEYLSLDGSTGEVIAGEVPLVEPELTDDFQQILKWADDLRRMKVRTNADTPHDAEQALKFGAEGIGLCRTEHMFFGDERLPVVREMILAKDTAARKAALAKLLPFQRRDFYEIFKVMKGLPVTVRLLDPPLHEFLPNSAEDQERVAKQLGVQIEDLRRTVENLREFNPMLGHRGCRLGLTYPEINEMQARAIIEAACQLAKEGIEVIPEIMIPLVGHVKEFEKAKAVIDKAAQETIKAAGVELQYLVGTMIEVPRAALVADKIAEQAEFFSFGTNDLTQMAMGFSRDDAGKFLPHYIQEGILETDPFVKLDQEGVGELVRIGIEKGRSVRGNLKIGICGEHGGEASSVEFCHRLGMDYVSCSPFRVPIARIAAAQAVAKEAKK